MGRVRGLLAVTGAALLVASGCSSNDEPNVIAAGDTAEAVVTAALDAAVSGSGRVQMGIEVDDAAMQSLMDAMREQAEELAREHGEGAEGIEDFEPWTAEDLEQTATVVFDGEDFSVSSDGEGQPDLLKVGDRTYQSVAAVTDWQRETYEDLPEEPLSGAFQSPELPDGIEWISTDPESGSYVIASGWSFSSPDEGPHPLRSDDLRDIADAGPSEVDGTATHRYTASLDKEAIAELHDLEDPADLSDGDSDGDSGDLAVGDSGALSEGDSSGEDPSEEEYEQRYSAVEDYLWEHLEIGVSIHLDDAGRLVRVEVSNSMDVGDYAGCFFLTLSAMPITLTADYSDLGGAVDLVAPPAESVISQEEYDELDSEAFDAWMRSGFDGMPELPEGPSDRSWGPDGEPIKLATADGERYRADIEDDLVKFGSVIGLDPAAVRDLDDAALVDAHDRASAALAALPTTTTALGELTRVELLWNVKWGMENFGMDPAAADAMGDQELAALIDGFVGEQGVSGDGVWGDGPMSMAEMESGGWFDDEVPSSEGPEGTNDYEVEDDFFYGSMFENCPA